MSNLASYFEDLINTGKIESAVILLSDGSDENDYEFTHGTRQLLDNTTLPVTPDDIVFLASCTKLLTTISILQLVEKGLLNLDAPLSTILPDLCSQPILTGFHPSTNAPFLSPIPSSNPITLRHLLTHSSGLPYPRHNALIKRYHTLHPSSPSLPTVPTRFLHPLIFAPGSAWEYGTGVDWAGVALERTLSTTLESYFHIHIFTPLSLPSSCFSFFPQLNNLSSRMTDLNPSDPLGAGLATIEVDIVTSATGCFGGHGGFCTPAAYLAVLKSLLRNDGKLLARATVDDMFRPHLEPAAQSSLTAHLCSPSGAGLSQGFGQSVSAGGLSFGLGGLYIGADGSQESKRPPGLQKGALCWGGGANSTWFVSPRDGVCGISVPHLKIPIDAEIALEAKKVFLREAVGTMAEHTVKRKGGSGET